MPTDALILHIETATTVCSAALSRSGSVLAVRELDEGYTHAENLHVFINEILRESSIAPKQLQAVALSCGPGSYTGLRIGSSAAKGLCFALGIPLITINTLHVMALAMKNKAPDARYFVPMIDAGRMEVYTSVFDNDLAQVEDIQALVLDGNSVAAFKKYPGMALGGTGMEKARDLLSTLSPHLLEKIRPSAAFMPGVAKLKWDQGDFTEITDFEPLYLKNYIAGKKKSRP